VPNGATETLASRTQRESLEFQYAQLRADTARALREGDANRASQAQTAANALAQQGTQFGLSLALDYQKLQSSTGLDEQRIVETKRAAIAQEQFQTGMATGQIGGQQTLAAQKQAVDLALQRAQASGTFTDPVTQQSVQTLQAQQQGFSQQLASIQQNLAAQKQASDIASQSAGLTGQFNGQQTQAAIAQAASIQQANAAVTQHQQALDDARNANDANRIQQETDALRTAQLERDRLAEQQRSSQATLAEQTRASQAGEAVTQAGVTGTFNGQQTQQAAKQAADIQQAQQRLVQAEAQLQQGQQQIDEARRSGDLNRAAQLQTTQDTLKNARDLQASQLSQQNAQFQQTFGLSTAQLAEQTRAAQAQEAATQAGLTGYFANGPTGTPGGTAGYPTAYGTQTLAGKAQDVKLALDRANATGNFVDPVTGQSAQTLQSQLQQATLSGQYQGAPTEQAREFNTTQDLSRAQLLAQASADPNRIVESANLARLFGASRGGQTPLPASYNALPGGTQTPATNFTLGAGYPANYTHTPPGQMAPLNATNYTANALGGFTATPPGTMAPVGQSNWTPTQFNPGGYRPIAPLVRGPAQSNWTPTQSNPGGTGSASAGYPSAYGSGTPPAQFALSPELERYASGGMMPQFGNPNTPGRMTSVDDLRASGWSAMSTPNSYNNLSDTGKKELGAVNLSVSGQSPADLDSQIKRQLPSGPAVLPATMSA
jgi:hypothetical protein